MIVAFKGGNNLIRWNGLYDELAEVYVNDATVTFTVKDEDGNAVAGAEDVAMPYKSGSDGYYRGLLLHSVNLEVDGKYFIECTATKTGFEGFRREQLEVQYKGRQ